MLIELAKDNFLDYLKMLGRSPETIRSYQADLRNLCQFLAQTYNGPVYAEDVSREDVQRFLLYLKEVRRFEDRSRSHALYTLRSCFKYLHGAEYVKSNPTALISNIKFQQKERAHLTEDEVYPPQVSARLQ